MNFRRNVHCPKNRMRKGRLVNRDTILHREIIKIFENTDILAGGIDKLSARIDRKADKYIPYNL